MGKNNRCNFKRNLRLKYFLCYSCVYLTNSGLKTDETGLSVL